MAGKKRKPESPQNILEFAIPAGAVVSGMKFMYDVGKDASGLLRTKSKLFVQLVDSFHAEGLHQVVVRLVNAYIHGLVIEKIYTHKNTARIHSIARWTAGRRRIGSGFGFGDEDGTKPANQLRFPRTIHPSESESICIAIDSADRKKHSPGLTLVFAYSPLDSVKEKSTLLKSNIRLDWSERPTGQPDSDEGEP